MTIEFSLSILSTIFAGIAALMSALAAKEQIMMWWGEHLIRKLENETERCDWVAAGKTKMKLVEFARKFHRVKKNWE